MDGRAFAPRQWRAVPRRRPERPGHRLRRVARGWCATHAGCRTELGRLRAARARGLLACGQLRGRSRLCRHRAESRLSECRRGRELAAARRAARASVPADVELSAPAVDITRALDRAEPARRRSPAGRDRARWAHALGRRRGDLGGSSSRRATDVHSLAWHPGVPGRAYEAGGGGAAFSIDGGETWQPADEGRDRNYTWSVAVDPDDPDCWYVSASTGPFAAHGRRDPQALLYRRRGQGVWQPLGGGLPEPLPSMPYALVAAEGRLFAGLADGRIWASDDRGDSWIALRLQERHAPLTRRSGTRRRLTRTRSEAETRPPSTVRAGGSNDTHRSVRFSRTSSVVR